VPQKKDKPEESPDTKRASSLKKMDEKTGNNKEKKEN
jgi:hypothetical protein